MNINEVKEVAHELVENTVNIRNHIENIYIIKPYITDLVLGGDMSESDFYSITSFLKPQARSPLWQNYFIKKIGAEKVKANDDAGDLYWKEDFYEHKISGFNENKMLNVVQVRIWQKCDYIIQYVDFDYNPPVSFLLKHDEMRKELKIMKATSAHGTKGANKDNLNIELRFSVPLDSSHWNRWFGSYKTGVFDSYKR